MWVRVPWGILIKNLNLLKIFIIIIIENEREIIIMKLDKETYTKEEVKNLLIKMLNYCEINFNKTNKTIGEFGLVPIQAIREDIEIVRKEVEKK